jgi:energy-coupling factor transporter ATP-binding protein EcfA2
MSPEILLLDEPTSGIDPRARRNLISLLVDLPVTMLVSTHDLSFVLDTLPRTIFLDEGKIVADGDTRQILEDPHLLEMHGL